MAGESDNVKVAVQSDLLQLVEQINLLKKHSDSLSESLKGSVEDVGKRTDEATKNVVNGLDKMRRFGSRIADQLKRDFMSLSSINAIGGALKLSSQFSGALKETITLSDAIRKLGPALGIAGKDFASFQTKMTKGLGEIGLSSDVAARTLAALAETPVKGQDALLAYSKSAGQLASISGQKGREGDIAGGLARVLQARGVDPNDVVKMQAVAEDVRRARNATGVGGADIVKNMETLFTGMSDDFRKTISTRGVANLAASGQAAGPNATTFIQEFLKLSKTQRAGIEARVGKIFGEEGINVDKVRALFVEAKKLGGGDVRLGIKAATGVESDEAAEGFIRLAESLDRVKIAQEAVKAASGTLESQYRSSMGMGEAFNASINRVKKSVAGPLSAATQTGTDLLSKAAESDIGAAAVVAGGATLAAVMAGGALRGLGGGMMGGEMKARAVEAATGEKVQRVEVINFPPGMGGGGGAGGAMGKIGGALGAAGAGIAIGAMANEVIESQTQGTTKEGFSGNAIERLIFKMDKFFGGESSRKLEQTAKIEVDLKSRSLQQAQSPGRGTSH